MPNFNILLRAWFINFSKIRKMYLTHVFFKYQTDFQNFWKIIFKNLEIINFKPINQQYYYSWKILLTNFQFFSHSTCFSWYSTKFLLRVFDFLCHHKENRKPYVLVKISQQHFHHWLHLLQCKGVSRCPGLLLLHQRGGYVHYSISIQFLLDK